MQTILEIIDLSTRYLEKKGVLRARREAEELIAHTLGMRRLDLYLNFERPLLDEELEPCRSALKRRGEREPLQYILGHVEFAGLKLEVSPSALIPRPETEQLVERIGAILEKRELKGKSLLDLGTGSGCIALALKQRFPSLEVVGTDLSSEALALAQRNASHLNLDLHLLHGDLFAPVKGRKFDFFVSNPPYVKESQLPELQREVQFEPKTALNGGATGIAFYEAIAKELRTHLQEGGEAWFEIGSDQGKILFDLFSSAGWQCALLPDWSGKDRFISVHFP